MTTTGFRVNWEARLLTGSQLLLCCKHGDEEEEEDVGEDELQSFEHCLPLVM